MGISRFSLLSALSWCSILFLVGFLLRKSPWILKKVGPLFLLVLHLLGVARLILPIEFHQATIVSIQATMTTDVSTSSPNSRMIDGIVLTIWALGAAISVLRLFLSSRRSQQLIKQYPTAAVGSLLLKQMTGGNCKIRVVYARFPVIPYATGLWKSVIVLPTAIYSPNELRNILRHEYTHIRYGHLWIKFCLSLVCCIYWWFPLLFLLRREVDTLLELLCDDHMLKTKTPLQALDYGELLLRSPSSPYDSDRVPQSKFSRENITLLRLERILDFAYNRNKTVKSIERASLVLIAVTVLISYSFVIQPRYEPTDISYTSFEVNSTEDYLLSSSTGTYFLVMGKQRIELDEDQARMLITDGFRVIDEGGNEL